MATSEARCIELEGRVKRLEQEHGVRIQAIRGGKAVVVQGEELATAACRLAIEALLVTEREQLEIPEGRMGASLALRHAVSISIGGAAPGTAWCRAMDSYLLRKSPLAACIRRGASGRSITARAGLPCGIRRLRSRCTAAR